MGMSRGHEQVLLGRGEHSDERVVEVAVEASVDLGLGGIEQGGGALGESPGPPLRARRPTVAGRKGYPSTSSVTRSTTSAVMLTAVPSTGRNSASGGVGGPRAPICSPRNIHSL